jgi:hypothetical protein
VWTVSLCARHRGIAIAMPDISKQNEGMPAAGGALPDGVPRVAS